MTTIYPLYKCLSTTTPEKWRSISGGGEVIEYAISSPDGEVTVGIQYRHQSVDQYTSSLHKVKIQIRKQLALSLHAQLAKYKPCMIFTTKVRSIIISY